MKEKIRDEFLVIMRMHLPKTGRSMPYRYCTSEKPVVGGECAVAVLIMSLTF
jgi:hypothetical protein